MKNIKLFLLILGLSSKAFGIGTELSCDLNENPEGTYGSVIWQVKVARFSFCLNYDKGGKCIRQIYAQDTLSSIPSAIEENRCHYVGKNLFIIHLRGNDYRVVYADKLGDRIDMKLKCSQIVSCTE